MNTYYKKGIMAGKAASERLATDPRSADELVTCPIRVTAPKRTRKQKPFKAGFAAGYEVVGIGNDPDEFVVFVCRE